MSLQDVLYPKKKKQADASPCEKCEWADKQQKGIVTCLWVTGCVKGKSATEK